MTTSKISKKAAAKTSATAPPLSEAAPSFKMTKAQFRLFQRQVRNQSSPEAQEFAALVGAFAHTQAAAMRAAERLSEMLHSDEHDLSSVQQWLEEHPVDARALMRLIGLERERDAGHIEREAHRRMSSKGGKTRDQNSGDAAKREEIRRRWATGKYKSRDECAEKESDALKMPFSTARKALRNTPDPDRST